MYTFAAELATSTHLRAPGTLRTPLLGGPSLPPQRPSLQARPSARNPLPAPHLAPKEAHLGRHPGPDPEPNPSQAQEEATQGHTQVLQPEQPQPHLEVGQGPHPAELRDQRTQSEEEPTEQVSHKEQLKEEEVEVLKANAIGPAPLTVPLEEVSNPQRPVIG